MRRDVLPPIVLQVVGLAAFVFFCGFWAATGRVEPLLLGASGTLYGAGLVQRAATTLRPGTGPDVQEDEGR